MNYANIVEYGRGLYTRAAHAIRNLIPPIPTGLEGLAVAGVPNDLLRPEPPFNPKALEPYMFSRDQSYIDHRVEGGKIIVTITKDPPIVLDPDHVRRGDPKGYVSAHFSNRGVRRHKKLVEKLAEELQRLKNIHLGKKPN